MVDARLLPTLTILADFPAMSSTLITMLLLQHALTRRTTASTNAIVDFGAYRLSRAAALQSGLEHATALVSGEPAETTSLMQKHTSLRRS